MPELQRQSQAGWPGENRGGQFGGLLLGKLERGSIWPLRHFKGSRKDPHCGLMLVCFAGVLNMRSQAVNGSTQGKKWAGARSRREARCQKSVRDTRGQSRVCVGGPRGLGCHAGFHICVFPSHNSLCPLASTLPCLFFFPKVLEAARSK